MSQGSKPAQPSLVLKPGQLRPRRLFLHFFDKHFLDERGTYARSERSQVEMDLAVRFAVIAGSEILVPAASYHENAIAARILHPFIQSELSGYFRFVGGGASLDEFRLDKLEQYRPGSMQHALYAGPLEQNAGWARRRRSATKDIADAWMGEPSKSDVFETFQPYVVGSGGMASFEKAWEGIPERLGREAFIVPHVIERLPVDPDNLTVQNLLHGKINRFYFNSYALDYLAAVMQGMPLTGGDVIPSGCPVDDIDFSALTRVCRAKGLLPLVRDCDISLLETIAFNAEFQEAFMMSQTDGPAILPPVETQAWDVAIVTALPKEREAVEAVFGKGRLMKVDGDPHVYKQIDLDLAGRKRRIIVATLSTMGNVRAAVLASNVLRSFPTGRIFMVGIAGGIPKPDEPSEHVRLGDVVIGSSVLQYDHGKRTAGGEIEVRDVGQRLLHEFFQLVVNLRSERYGFDTDWLAHRDAALRSYDIDPSNLPPDVLRNSEGDEIEHPADPRRRHSPSMVHFGVIGAGDTLLKDPVFRDELSRDHRIVAVEMESTGLRDAGWANERTVGVIRGVVDYCDGHKDDEWHNVAALPAAAMMRFLFEKMVEIETA